MTTDGFPQKERKKKTNWKIEGIQIRFAIRIKAHKKHCARRKNTFYAHVREWKIWPHAKNSCCPRDKQTDCSLTDNFYFQLNSQFAMYVLVGPTQNCYTYSTLRMALVKYCTLEKTYCWDQVSMHVQ